MTCLNPKPVKFHWTNIISKQTGEIKPVKKLNFKSYLEPIDVTTDFIPCGTCEGCKIDKANDWATRAYLESLNHEKNCFLTLTYDNEHLPKPKTLVKRDLQLFWKKLRKQIAPQKIIYLAAGEYGLRTRRPHYHCAIFNYWPHDAKPYKKNEMGDILYTSETLSKIWGNGFIILGTLTYQSAAYIARYVYKKAYGGDTLNLKKHQIPEFITCSKRPAIAKNYFFDNEKWQKILRNNGIFLPTPNGLKIKPIPRYLLNLYKLWDWANYYQWQEKQRQNRIKNQEQIMSKTDKTIGWYLQQQKEIKKHKLKILDNFRKDL